MLNSVDEPRYCLAISFLDWLNLSPMTALRNDSVKVFFSFFTVILAQMLEFLPDRINIPVSSIPSQQLAFNVREAGHVCQSTRAKVILHLC